ncbi:hypothetical protein E4U21_004588 [Claviceps maximensis]|nr:hypothetical protein E4U21_004588 [Claviceps maximensis]
MMDELLAEDAHDFPYNNKLRGLRGPGVDYAAELEKRMPIMQEKLEKPHKSGGRESKLGLRNIFAMSRLSRDVQSLTDPMAVFRSNGSRISLASIQQPSQPISRETSLANDFSWTPLPVTLEDSGPEQLLSLQRSRAASTIGSRVTPPRPARQFSKGSSTAWSPPPLFKAFPQAIHHVTLPATSLNADAILRMNGRRNSLQGKESDDTATLNATEPDHGLIERDEGKSKKKTRRNGAASSTSFKWTRKLYVLVTSGYLLQYSGEGTYDRLPEKVLRLGPLSAAFATDAIPGRHWVIQISSKTDMDDAPAAESRSIFSKLSFRTAERRTATNLLMVFEDAESMEGWLTALRTEIEKQGGKKKLSETGRPKNETAEESPRDHVSQRTPIVRDPSRFASSAGSTAEKGRSGSSSGSSSSGSRDGRSRVWTLESESRYGETSPQSTSSKATRNQSLDDVSTINSIVSQDERHLESLREHSNRLSFISSGQRTFATSSGSSLDDSPTHDTPAGGVFGGHEAAQAEVKSRLNPLKMSSQRREFVQGSDPFADDGSSFRSNSRVTSQRVTAISGERMVSHIAGATPPPTSASAATPNFSVPQTSSRRYSCVSSPRSRDEEASSPSGIRDSGSSPRTLNRIQPVAMQSAQRLSDVTDPFMSRSIATEQLRASCTSPTWPTGEESQKRRLRSVSRGRVNQRQKERLPESPRDSPDSMMKDIGWSRSPRRHVSTSALRQGASSPTPKSQTVPPRMPHIAQLLAFNHVPDTEEVRGQSMKFLNKDDGDVNTRTRSLEPETEPEQEPEPAKRLSTGYGLSARSSVSYDIHGSIASSINSSDSCGTITCGSQSASGHYPDAERTPRYSCIHNQRSMLRTAVDGPPPAPPPTRALPPIPPKARSRR